MLCCGFSSRRFTNDLRDALIGGFINSTPHFNSVSNYLAKPELAETLRALAVASSLPLKPIETNFAVDSSGFSTGRFISRSKPSIALSRSPSQAVGSVHSKRFFFTVNWLGALRADRKWIASERRTDVEYFHHLSMAVVR